MEASEFEDVQSPPATETETTSSDDGRFSFDAVYRYLSYQQYPEGSSKLEKNSLRRRAKYFRVQNEDLLYIGGGKLQNLRKI